MQLELTGTLFDDKYEILKAIGSGAFGTVYLATQADLGRQVALKILRPELLADPSVTDRFHLEAKALSKLDHKNIIVPYKHAISSNNTAYLAMEFFEGKSLAQMLRSQTPLPLSQTVDIASQVCEALAHANQNGILHRDLKPANILFNGTTVKVIDFGLAKIIGAQQIQKLTQTGFLIGTASYMSPEICLGEKPDSRGDIYSLGCILYECLTGYPPFAADTAVGTMFMHTNAEIPRIGKSIGEKDSGELNKILARALAKSPGDRFQTMDEFRAALQSIDRSNNSRSNEEAPAVIPELKGKARVKPLSVANCESIAIACGVFALTFAVASVCYKQLNNVVGDTRPLTFESSLTAGKNPAQPELDNGRSKRALALVAGAKGYRRVGQLKQAAVLLDDAIELVATIKEPDKAKPIVYWNTALLYVDQTRYIKAVPMIKKAQAEWKAAGETGRARECYAMLAYGKVWQVKSKATLGELIHALDSFPKKNALPISTAQFESIGNLARQSGYLKEAITLYDYALITAQPQAQFLILFALANCNAELSNIEEAKQCYRQCLEVLQQSKIHNPTSASLKESAMRFLRNH